MTHIGFIKDKNGKWYDVMYWVSTPTGDRRKYNIGIYDKDASAGEKQAGEFELDVYEGEDYAEIDQAYFEIAYRRLGLYSALLPLMRDFIKTQGCKGIFSRGNLRNAMSNAAWEKIPDRKTIPKKYDTNNNASAYPDYALERRVMVTSLGDFRLILNESAQADEPVEKEWLPEFVYHVSPKQNEQNILNNGITLNTGGRTHLHRDYSPRVYFATSLIAAYDIQLNFNSHDGHDYIIFKIDTSKLDGEFFDDSKFVHGVWSQTPVPRDAIVGVIDPSDLHYNDEDLDKLYDSTWHDYEEPSQTNEDRQQQIIPFEEPEFQKLSIHAHLQDAFNDLSVMRPDMYYSHGNPEDKMAKLRDKVLNFIMTDGDGDDTTVMTEYVWNFTRAYDPNTDPEMYSKKFIKHALSEEEDALEDLYKFAEIAAKESNIKSVFSNAGWSQFKRIAINQMDADTENMRYAVDSSYKENENGLIECWRVVDYVPGPNDDYYVNVMAHGGVGVYWSWDEKAAEAHQGNSAGHSITLHGLISVENVDWYETMWKNAYNLKDEKEIRTISNGNVMIVGYHDNEKDQYASLEHPVVVKTGQ